MVLCVGMYMLCFHEKSRNFTKNVTFRLESETNRGTDGRFTPLFREYSHLRDILKMSRRLLESLFEFCKACHVIRPSKIDSRFSFSSNILCDFLRVFLLFS